MATAARPAAGPCRPAKMPADCEPSSAVMGVRPVSGRSTSAAKYARIVERRRRASAVASATDSAERPVDRFESAAAYGLDMAAAAAALRASPPD
jgi:hypothetical protein